MVGTGFHVRLPEDLRQELEKFAEEHERTLNGEINFALKIYVSQQKTAKAQVERIVGFWLSQMWGSEDFGRVTSENLYRVIQKYSDHPDKGLVSVEDCAQALKQWAQEGTPQDWPQAKLEIVEEE